MACGANVHAGWWDLAGTTTYPVDDNIDVGCVADDRVHQARFSVHTHVHFHAEVPLVAVPGLMHLQVTLTGLVLGRAERRNDAGIDHRARLEQQALMAARTYAAIRCLSNKC